jgi:hypothetical protein
MPGLTFSGANLATVAYALVDSAVGASPTMNSGVQTTKLSLGKYQIILPTTLALGEGSDMVLIQACETPTGGAGVAARMAVVDNSLAITKLVYFWDGDPAQAHSSNIDTSFLVLVLKSTLTPPAGSPY